MAWRDWLTRWLTSGEWRMPAYGEEDRKSAMAKTAESQAPGAFVELTDREWAAVRETDWYRSGKTEGEK